MNTRLSFAVASVCVLFTAESQASTLTVSNGTIQNTGFGLTYQSDGFVWSNPSGYGSDCQATFGDPNAVTLFALDNLYSHEGCGNNAAFSRADGTRFDVSSVDVIAQDFTQITPDTTGPADGHSFLHYQLDEFRLDAEINAAGIDRSDQVAVDAFVAAKQAERDTLISDYFGWLYSSSAAPARDQFYVAGVRDGGEVIRQYYSDTNGPTSLALSGFSDLDEVVFGYNYGNFLWDQYYRDSGGHAILGTGELWCPHKCEELAIYGFDYTLGGTTPATVVPTPQPADPGNPGATDPSAAVASVPLPGGAGMIVFALGLLGLGARRRA